METEFKVEGLKELYDMLQQLPVKLEKNILRGAIRAGSKSVADEARRRAPVLSFPDPRREMGALSKSVRVMSTGVRGGVVKGGVVAGGKTTVGRGKSKVAADAFYAKFVEFGTAKMRAHPFMRPAVDTRTQQAIDATAAYIRDRVEAGDLTK
jgi:HK97 gp10 family phage protein